MPTSGQTHTKERDGKGRYTHSPESAERDAEACRLRGRGRTYQEIANELGYADRSHARQAVERGRRATFAEPAAEVRDMELERLDYLWTQALAVLERNHITVSHGRIIRDEEEKPILDDAPKLQAIDRLVRIQERRAKLLGLDSPVKVEQSGQVKYEVVGVDPEALR